MMGDRPLFVRQAPSRWALLREFLDLPVIFSARILPVVKTTAQGKGVPVLVIPGLLSNDGSIDRLVRSLNAAGFSACGWGQGINLGLRPGLLERLCQRLKDMADTFNQPVVLLGWSLGGVYARELARLRPELVRCVVTMGSPFSGSPRANNGWRIYEALNDHSVDNPPVDTDLAIKPPVPTMAVWSGRDGVVSPVSARGMPGEADAEHEIAATHFAMGTREAPIRQIVELLAGFAQEQSL